MMPSHAQSIVSDLLEAGGSLARRALRSQADGGLKRVFAYDIVHCGISLSDYVQGYPTGDYDVCIWGVGDSPAEALEDALTMSDEWDTSTITDELPYQPSAYAYVLANLRDYLSDDTVADIDEEFPEDGYVDERDDAISDAISDAGIETPYYYLYLRLSNDPTMAESVTVSLVDKLTEGTSRYIRRLALTAARQSRVRRFQNPNNRGMFAPNTSVIRGTSRIEDIGPAFLSELQARNPAKYDEFTREHRAEVELLRDAAAGIGDGPEGDDWVPLAYFVWETLMGTMSDMCPDFTFFGAHPGDGSDLGCWVDQGRIEEDEHYEEVEVIQGNEHTQVAADDFSPAVEHAAVQDGGAYVSMWERRGNAVVRLWVAEP